LKAPFKLPVERHEYLTRWFTSLIINEQSFQIKIEDFSSFLNNKVIFINPQPSVPLVTLQQSIIRQFKKEFPEITISQLEKDFHPHITVAYRDLTAGRFADAWSEYRSKKYSAVFPVNGFHLLQHDTKRWNIIHTHKI
jgi:2'-5' RNA ligase